MISYNCEHSKIQQKLIFISNICKNRKYFLTFVNTAIRPTLSMIWSQIPISRTRKATGRLKWHLNCAAFVWKSFITGVLNLSHLRPPPPTYIHLELFAYPYAINFITWCIPIDLRWGRSNKYFTNYGTIVYIDGSRAVIV